MAEIVICYSCKAETRRESLKRTNEGEACPGCGSMLLFNPGMHWKQSIPYGKWKEIEQYVVERRFGLAGSKILKHALCSVVQCDRYLLGRVKKLNEASPALTLKQKLLMLQLKSLFKLGFYEKLVAVASAYEKNPPPTREFDVLLAHSLDSLDQRRRAFLYYRNAYLQDPKDKDQLERLAKLLIRMGHMAQARRYIEELQRENKDDTRIPVLLFKLNEAIKKEAVKPEPDTSPEPAE